MLRDGLNHVLCRKRRETIRRRSPEYHRWQSHRRMRAWRLASPTLRNTVGAAPDAVASQRVRELIAQHGRQQLQDLQRIGVLR